MMTFMDVAFLDECYAPAPALLDREGISRSGLQVPGQLAAIAETFDASLLNAETCVHKVRCETPPQGGRRARLRTPCADSHMRAVHPHMGLWSNLHGAREGANPRGWSVDHGMRSSFTGERGSVPPRWELDRGPIDSIGTFRPIATFRQVDPGRRPISTEGRRHRIGSYAGLCRGSLRFERVRVGRQIGMKHFTDLAIWLLLLSCLAPSITSAQQPSDPGSEGTAETLRRLDQRLDDLEKENRAIRARMLRAPRSGNAKFSAGFKTSI